MNEIEISKLGTLRAISPEETAQKFLDGKGVSAPQKLSGFFQKMISKRESAYSPPQKKISKNSKSLFKIFICRTNIKINRKFSQKI